MTPDEIVSKLVAEARRYGLEEEVATQLCQEAYLVWTGSYSDATVRGVFLSHCRAQKFMEHFKGDDERIQVQSLRSADNVLDPGCWVANIHLEDDPIIRAPNFDREEHLRPAWVHCWWWPFGNKWNLTVIGYGRTPEHASRSAEEKRREIQALGLTAEAWAELHKIPKG